MEAKLFFNLLLLAIHSEVDSTLQLVHVFFRHGSRAPVDSELFPNSPHMEIWNKIGLGRLTNIGKNESLQLGYLLRNRYEHFISENYNSEEIMVKSTPYNRTRETASLLLQGMFSTYDFQDKTFSDNVLRHAYDTCPAYVKEFNRVGNLSKFRELGKKYEHVFNSITLNTRKDCKTVTDVFFIFHYFSCVNHNNFPLPQWFADLYGEVYKIAILQYKIQNFNSKLKMIGVGTFLKEATMNMKRKSKNLLLPTSRKVFLYSVHDVHIAGILSTMGVFKPHIPNYNAALTIELHFDDISKYFIKIFYIHHINEEPIEMVIKACGNPCGLDKFEEILYPYLPGDYTNECESPVLLEKDD